MRPTAVSCSFSQNSLLHLETRLDLMLRSRMQVTTKVHPCNLTAPTLMQCAVEPVLCGKERGKDIWSKSGDALAYKLIVHAEDHHRADERTRSSTYRVLQELAPLCTALASTMTARERSLLRLHFLNAPCGVDTITMGHESCLSCTPIQISARTRYSLGLSLALSIGQY